MKKIMLVFGTRPDAIKMAPLVSELKKRPAFGVTVCVTGQHRDMLDGVLRAFGITPDADLRVMREEQTLFGLTADTMNGMRDVLRAAAPDAVLVHGDTTTAFSAALACYYLGIPVGHVEAGLRTYDLSAPFPEEFNRRAVGLLSSLDFAPTPHAKENLLKEGKDPRRVFVTGNTVIDAMRLPVKEEGPRVLPELLPERTVLLTAHRRENLGQPMRGALRAVKRVLAEHPDVRVIFPVHPNPAVRQIAEEELGDCGQVLLTGPLGVAECRRLEKACFLCLTDSGGLQEECAALGKPVLVLRNRTERTEGVDEGTALPVGTGEEDVYRAFSRQLDGTAARPLCSSSRPYGDGEASRRIADVLETGTCGEYVP